jgi:hypothetical protein
MQGGGRAGDVEDGKKRKAAALGGEKEVVEEATMSVGASRATTVDTLHVGASTIGTGGIRPVVEEAADLPAGDSATVHADGDAGASTLADVAAGVAVIGTAGQAAGNASLVKPELEKEVCTICR